MKAQMLQRSWLKLANKVQLNMAFKVILLCVCLIISATSAKAWTARGKYHNEEHPGKCYISEALILSPGESAKDPKGCSKIYCTSANGMVNIHGCGAVGAPENCIWTDHLNKNAPFPLCCLRNFNCTDAEHIPMAQMMQQHMREMFTKRLEKSSEESNEILDN